MATEKRLIDADKPIRETESIINFRMCHHMPTEDYESFLNYLKKQPTVDAVEVVHGRWVLTAHEERANYRWNVTAECSECQHSKGEIYAGCFTGFPKDLVAECIIQYAKKVKLDNYCPNCGAKMRGSEE